MEEVRGSIPRSSTLHSPAFLAGLVAGDGCFGRSIQPATLADGSRQTKFWFAVELVENDAQLLGALAKMLGVGSIKHVASRNERWQATARYDVRSHRQLRDTVIPFFDFWLFGTRKRQQFETWRGEFEAYEDAHPNRWGRGRAVCSADGCEKPVRGRGLCRSHYYQVTGW